MKARILTLVMVIAGLGGAPNALCEGQKSDYVLFVSVKVKREKVRAFKDALLAIVEPTRGEEGNLAYVVHQATNDPTEFAVYERWETDEAHQNHLASSFFKKYQEVVGAMIKPGYPVKKQYIELN